MLQFQEFDLKTGKDLTDFHLEGKRTPRVKQVENCYLEKWLQTHRIEPKNLHVANFYNGVNDSDRVRLEAKGNKYLICTSGKSGYFTDRATAELIAKGDNSRNIQPIYADGERSAHNAVAYGSLVVSDGNAATTTKSGNSRILIIDDDRRSNGTNPLKDRDGRNIPVKQLADLYDKMGDGTMLASTKLLRGLLLDKEVLLAIDRGLQQAEDINDDELGDLGEWIDAAFGDSLDPELAGKLLEEFKHTGRISNYFVDLQTAQTIEKKIDRLARSSVLQFRAATPDLPGIAKGTMATSSWCERLGVDAIVSTNDIKGDDGRLKEPGIVELESFLWVNRKIKAEYSNQSVGAQVKGTIPDATLNELNPMMAAKASSLADVAVDNWQLASKFVAKEEARRERELIIDTPEGIDGVDDDEPRNNRSTLAKLLKADRYGQLNQLPNISRQLDKSLRRDRLDVATNGIVVPAAIAQHHSKLEPWETCNRDLPHGAIVAYYRSPFPNVGAAAIAINNLEVLRDRDPEAFDKRGVVYLNPWTAKHIAITDFDGDRNGFFVGYLANDNLPRQLREQLGSLPLAGGDLYEAGRAVIAQIINRSDLEQGKFPLTVKEFIEANAPDRKPLPIAKAKKADHLWHQSEPLTQAIWRAWDITANNPTGRVANQSIILQSIASETVYIEPQRKIGLLKQIGAAYSEIPIEEIPSDEYLQERGLPPMQLAEKIESIVQASKQLDKLPAAERLAFAERNLGSVNRLLKNYCDSAVAKNLQTAVDTAKSSVGIDEIIHEFGERIQYKSHQLRQNVKKPDIYFSRDLPTNTQEPIGWAVETANRFYNGGQQPQLQEIESDDLNKRFRSLIPIIHNDAQKAVVDEFARKYRNCTSAIGQVKDRLNRELVEDQQPTLTIVSSSGKSFEVQRLCDADAAGDSPIWDLGDGQSSTRFEIYRNREHNGKENYVVYQVDGAESRIAIGYVSPVSAIANSLDKYPIAQIGSTKKLFIERSTLEFHPPYALENDVDEIFTKADRVINELENSIPKDKRTQYTSAAWHSSVGMGMATKVFANEISQYLDRVPPIALNRPTKAALELRDGTELAIRFERDLHISEIAPDGSTHDLGLTTYGDSPLLSPGTVVAAKIARPLDPKIHIHTEIGEFVVNPTPAIGLVQIEEFTGRFAFERWGKDIAVDYLGSGGRRIPIGVLGRELINKDSKANLKSGSNLLKGTLSRGLSKNILEIHIQRLIDHQPVASMDLGEIIPLPQQSILLKRHDRAVSSDRRYFPTAGELRQLYGAAELTGDIAKMAELNSLGTLLNDVYPDGDRAPDDFSHWVVEIPVSDALYYPSAGELRTAYTLQSISGKTKDLDRIKELGNALNRVYPDGNRAPDDFSSLKVGITTSEKRSLEIDVRHLESFQSTNLDDTELNEVTSLKVRESISISQEPTVIVPVNRSKNFIVLERSQTEDIDLSM
ncbi:hypothetical protein [Chamaesiphon sp.]|uniref:hypothetical protein n=1 Tax=Chamaesiphon sp. TaxID=2814140 RepID=UPI0035940E23